MQGPYIALLLSSKKIKKSRANLFLSILLIALSFSIAHIVYAAKVLHHLSAEVYSLGDPTFLLIAPLLWFYTIELTGQRVRSSARMIFHFIPFLMIIIFSLSFKAVGSESFELYIDEHNRLIRILFWVLVVTQFSCYQFLLHRKLLRHHQLMHQEVSNPEGINLSWVRFFMIIFLLINIFFLFSLFAVIHLTPNTWLPRTTAVIFSLSVYALGYKGILQKEIFLSADQQDQESPRADAQNSLHDQVLISRIVEYMSEQKPYLDPELTLTRLAQALNVSRSQLSQLINSGIGDNFYDFVNKYRVEEVKRLMADPKVQHYSLLGIALEAGFKSKSTFNLIFKRFTGLTPTEFRKNISQ